MPTCLAHSTNFDRLTIYFFPNHCRPFGYALLPLRCLDSFTPSVNDCLTFHPLTLSTSLGRPSFGKFTLSLSAVVYLRAVSRFLCYGFRVPFKCLNPLCQRTFFCSVLLKQSTEIIFGLTIG